MRRNDSIEPESKTRMQTAWRGCRSDDDEKLARIATRIKLIEVDEKKDENDDLKMLNRIFNNKKMNMYITG